MGYLAAGEGFGIAEAGCVYRLGSEGEELGLGCCCG